MKTLLPLVRRCIFLCLIGSCWAAQAEEMTLEGQGTALSCLIGMGSDAKPIAYPKEAFERKEGALVRLQIKFTGPDLEPTISVLGNSGDSLFASLAKKHAADYRLPCMSPGVSAVMATQEFSFKPTDDRPVSWSEVKQDFSPLGRCVLLDGESFPWRRTPRYPTSLIRNNIEGTVLSSMTFTSNDRAPEIRFLFDGGSSELAASVKKYLEDLRLPCLPAGETLTVHLPFSFRVEGNAQFVLRDLTLQQFLGAAEPSALEAPSGKVRFDLSTMGCPFELRLKLYQPYRPNAVGEVGPHDERRNALLAWLKSLPLALDAARLKRVIGQETTISVPCGLVDLT